MSTLQARLTLALIAASALAVGDGLVRHIPLFIVLYCALHLLAYAVSYAKHS
jgi:hypothetical protein